MYYFTFNLQGATDGLDWHSKGTDIFILYSLCREAQKVLIRANSKDWLPSQGLDSSSYGKQQHIAWIVTELFNTKHAIIRPEEILLMDDDSDNVTLAENFGHQAYEVPEDVTMKSIQSFVELMEVKVSSPDHWLADGATAAEAQLQWDGPLFSCRGLSSNYCILPKRGTEE